ncbi:MAG: type IV pilus secretin PilQ [Bdellovibrionaceae bacterium]|nr:type IV pilus secretin PilQ [Pseudobdellovibrionaceae bacterium]
MFFHLCLVFMFVSLTSCSMFDSEDTVGASEIEGEAANIEIESSDTGEDLESFEDLDIESADASAKKTDGTQASGGTSDDSFNDIENFNEGMIENELSDENIATSSIESNEPSQAVDAPAGEVEDLDLEVANLEPSVESASAAATKSASVSTSGNKITNLEYKSEQSGGSVVISANSAFEYQVRDEPEFNQTIIEIADIELPDRFKLPYIAKDFEQAVATVNAYQENGSSTARFVIQYKEKLKPAIQLVGNKLMVVNSGVSSVVAGTRSGKADGKKISIEMQDVNIKDLIYFIADEVGVNIIVDDNVTGVANVKLRDVPWEEALSIILKTNELAYERRGEILRVAKISSITKEFQDEAARLEAQDIAVRASQSRAVKVVPVNYANLDDLITQVKPFLTPTGQVIIDKRSSSIILNDFDGPLKRAEKLIKSLDIQPVQILIEGKIIEASEDFSREFGIQWGHGGGTVDAGSQALSFSQSIRADRSPNNVAGGYVTDLTFGTFDALGEITALLAIYEREQKVKILSSPKIVTLNKEKATIETTTQVPNVQVQVVPNVGTSTTVVFQDAKLSLAVTPQVSFNSDVILDLEVSRDVPGPTVGTNGSRGINKRFAKTKVVVKDGQSLVLGGVFSQDENYLEGGLPFLKDIPVLGYLFKTKSKEILKSELVIFLTPRILNPENMLRTTEISSTGEVVKSPSEAGGSATPASGSSPAGDSSDEIESEVESL